MSEYAADPSTGHDGQIQGAAMSDLEIMREMLTRAGVAHEYSPGRIDISHDNKADGANPGYSGFLTEIIFHADGRLKSVGAWE